MRTPWPDHIADTPVARLAWELQAKYPCEMPPHLAIEALALCIAEAYGLWPPVTFIEAERFLGELGIQVNPPGKPNPPKRQHGIWQGTVEEGGHWIRTSDRDALTKQTLVLFHEFYEILRAYLHAFRCAPFPPGMSKNDYVPEHLANRFAAAITMPKPFMHGFLLENGLDVPLLLERTARSSAAATRRIRELVSGRRLAAGTQLTDDDQPLLGEEVPFLAIRCALKPKLLMSDVPRFMCIEHIRSYQLSLRRRKSGRRDYHVPRTNEEWSLGTLIREVMQREAPVFARRVTGFDLFGERDLCALAFPEMDEERVSAVAIYATPARFADLWGHVVGRLECGELAEVPGLAGPAAKVPRMKPRRGDLRNTPQITTLGGKTVEVEVYDPPRRKPPEPEAGEDESAEAREPQLAWIYAADALLFPLMPSDAPAPVEVDEDEESLEGEAEAEERRQGPA